MWGLPSKPGAVLRPVPPSGPDADDDLLSVGQARPRRNAQQRLADQGGLPVAVEITLALRAPLTEEQENTTAPNAAIPVGAGSTIGTGDLIYQLIVRLPTAEPTNEALTTTEETAL